MKTLKFLFTSTFYPPYHIGGDAVHVKYLAKELAKCGHEVHFLHSLDAYRVKKKRSSKRDEEAYDNAYVHPIQTPFNLSPYITYLFGNSPAVIRKFESLLREIKPDVVHHHNISLLGYNLLRKKDNYLNLYTAHDYWLICQQNNLMKARNQVCERPRFCSLCALKRCKPLQLWRHSHGFKTAVRDIDILIAPSNYLKEKILEKFSVRAVTIQNFAPEPPQDIKSSEFSNFFLYAGVLEEHKGILHLIKVYGEICNKIQRRLIIVGDGNLRTQIDRYIRRMKLENKIFVLGFVSRDRLYSLLKDADALIIPSIWPENNPLVALEALSLGTPVITSNMGGLPEIIGKINDKLVYGSISELKWLLLNYDAAYKEKLLARLKEIYEKHYTPEAYLSAYFGILRKW